MNKQRYHTRAVAPLFLIMLATTFFDPGSRLQESAESRVECSALDKSKPAQFISFEGFDRNAWDGKRYVKGLVLRLTNNSSCAMLVVTPPGVAPRLIKKKGKYVWQDDWHTPELKNGSHIEVVYTIHFLQSNRSETPVPSGDVILKSKVLSGESVLFSVPKKFVKQGGEIELAFHYESNPRTESIHFSLSQARASVR